MATSYTNFSGIRPRDASDLKVSGQDVVVAPAGNFTVSGLRTQAGAIATDTVLFQSNSGTIYGLTTSTAAYNITLPTPATGLHFKFICTGAISDVDITCPGAYMTVRHTGATSATMVLIGSSTTATNVSVALAVAGDVVDVVGLSATSYYVEAHSASYTSVLVD